MGFNSSGRKNAISALISLALHGCACLLLCISFNARIKPPVLHVMKVSLARPEPPKPEPPKPPKVELPKPEPPKPPKVEPPKPEPPKPQKVEQPKPEPPKVVKPLPEPPKPKQDPPKPKQDPPKPKQDPPKPKQDPPKPKQDPPKPKQDPPKPQARQLSLEERIRNAETVTKRPAPKTIDANKINEMLRNALKQESANPSSSEKSTEIASAGIVAETSNYAEQVVKPYIQRNWIQPVKGELDVRNPTPVEISFMVYAQGSVANVRIVKRSNSNVLNASVEKFTRELKMLSPLSSIGSRAQSLRITVSMVLTN